MWSLYKKEIRSFFSSLTAYLTIITFLVLTGLFLFVFPGGLNVLTMGYAGLDSLFIIAPWVFLFLIPAITMRMFSDEIRHGTIELLLTRPLSEWHLVLGKYLASLTLVVLSLLPSLLYVATIYMLGDPPGNFDTGATIGSYIGLLLLGASYAALGLIASALTENSIVSFLVGVFLCFFFFYITDQIASLSIMGKTGLLLSQFSISEHYNSISRGVIDSRDVTYFASLVLFSLAATRLILIVRRYQ
ncbi:gliding motility-associated ABC transporter permease subunit GldF [Schleiferia thermophila]|jgi:ABC-2 type transport system permease protein|uniref:Protein involved in gliding motility GldF n=1 Tax=Schleiferia thermophila TaxID=884107 RepID=A0A369A212_9FLAO|nr:gliding motility-associated ABC transporter permease subunit GldF [Schleiferia thermophila]KFD39290.1 ABC transporter permease [Schleiferia thermophila str. Yellowstone]RCX03193.1 protein involved in gliding motility GldF [Schleiferia thermophila]GCD80322.1 gliding motility-associated ABC transporter permease subunit GldF [Schleiferia thermophila]